MRIIIPVYRLSESRKRALEYVLKGLPEEHPYTLAESDDLVYNKPKIINKAVQECKEEEICILDGDVVLDWSKIEPPRPGTFVRPFTKCIRLTAVLTRELYAGNKISPSPELPVVAVDGGGAFLICKEDFIALHGFHEEYVGWGYEDADFGARAIRKLKRVIVQQTAYHLWHDNNRANMKDNRKIFQARAQLHVNAAVRSTKGLFGLPMKSDTHERHAPKVPTFTGEKKQLDMDVLTMFYGYNPVRFDSFERTLEAWDKSQEYMPRVHLAWCYKDRPAPKYPWLKVYPMPQYDLSDGVMRKEGLLNYLIARTSSEKILTLDADAWCEDPQWFKKTADKIEGDTCVQPFAVMQDTHDPITVYSWTSSFLPKYQAKGGKQPGLGWGFTREWVRKHGDEPVFNPWCVTGSGDCLFLIEHCKGIIRTGSILRHTNYRYIVEHTRKLPNCDVACVEAWLWHQCHTDHSAVPSQYKNKAYSDRSYIWSRAALEWWGSVHQYIYLDENGVPMLIDPQGPFAKFISRKAEMQTKSSTMQVALESLHG